MQVSGEYGKLYGDALDLSERLPISVLVSDAPTRISGYKTAVFEIYDSLAPKTPDVIALPASSGGFASGVWLGIRDLESAGLIDDPPRMCLVQTAAADPLTRAFEAGAIDPTPMSPDETGDTIAHSIGNPDPPSGASGTRRGSRHRRRHRVRHRRRNTHRTTPVRGRGRLLR